MPKYEVTYYEKTVKTARFWAPDEAAAYDWELILNAEAEADYNDEKYELDILDVKEVEGDGA